MFICAFSYLKVLQRQRERQREIFQTLFHSPNGHHNRSWVVLRPEARSVFWFSCATARIWTSVYMECWHDRRWLNLLCHNAGSLSLITLICSPPLLITWTCSVSNLLILLKSSFHFIHILLVISLLSMFALILFAFVWFLLLHFPYCTDWEFGLCLFFCILEIRC